MLWSGKFKRFPIRFLSHFIWIFVVYCRICSDIFSSCFVFLFVFLLCVFPYFFFFFVHVRVYFGKSIRCDTKMVIRTNNIFSLCASQNHILFSLLFVYILYIINIFGIILKQTIFDRALYEHMETRSAYPFNHTHE